MRTLIRTDNPDSPVAMATVQNVGDSACLTYFPHAWWFASKRVVDAPKQTHRHTRHVGLFGCRETGVEEEEKEGREPGWLLARILILVSCPSSTPYSIDVPRSGHS